MNWSDSKCHRHLAGTHTVCLCNKVVYFRAFKKEILYPVYTIQPVVKPVVQPVWQLAVSCKQTSNRLSNRFDSRLDVCLHDTAGLSTVLNKQPLFVQLCWRNSHCSFNRLSYRVVQPVWQPAVYTIQPVVKPVVKRASWMFVYTIRPVVKPVWQPVVSCIQTFNRFDLTSCETGLTTGCIV